MKILIVDDDPINQRFLDAMLEDFGEIDLASDGLQAIELIEQKIKSKQTYDVIFLDIMMPHMDGHETLQRIKKMEDLYQIENSKRTKVIMVTALGDKENLLSAFSEGCEYYLVKPFKQSKVFQLMEELGFKRQA